MTCLKLKSDDNCFWPLAMIFSNKASSRDYFRFLQQLPNIVMCFMKYLVVYRKLILVKLEAFMYF